MLHRRWLSLTLVLALAPHGCLADARPPSRQLDLPPHALDISREAAIVGAQTRAPRPGRLRAGWTRLKDRLRDGVAAAGLSLACYRARPLDPVVRAQIDALQPPMKRTRFIGETFFPLYAKEEGLEVRAPSPVVGLIPNLDELRSEDFDPDAVHPAVRDFYERTGQYQLTVTAKSDTLGRVIMGISNRVAKAVGNGRVPLKSSEQQLGSDLMELDMDRDGLPDARTWTRTYARNREPALIGYYRSVMLRERPYVAVVFPYTVGNQISILRLTNRSDGGVTLTSRDGSDPFAGDYFCRVNDEGVVTRAEPFTLIAQELDVYPDPQTGLPVADHRFFGLGKIRVQLRYQLSK